MDGVATPIIGRPRPLPGHDTPNPANNTYTLNYEEPICVVWCVVGGVICFFENWLCGFCLSEQWAWWVVAAF